MPKCCSCSSSGVCKACSCTRGRRRCLDCVPSRYGRCANITLPGSQSTPGGETGNAPLSVSSTRSSSSKSLSSSSSSSSASSSLSSACLPASSQRRSSVTGAGAASISRTQGSDRAPRPGAEGKATTPAAPNTSARALATPAPSGKAQHSAPRHDQRTPTTGRVQLPEFKPSSATNFSWGLHTGAHFAHAIECAYAEIVHWRRNTFMTPSGKVGKDFVRELTSLFTAYAQGSALESVALTAIMVACATLLQKPHPSSKCKDHVRALECRLSAWRNGDIDGLMREGRTMQTHLRSLRFHTAQGEDEHNARVFSRLMLKGKTHAALRVLSENPCAGLLSQDDQVDGQTVFDILQSKHPSAAEVDRAALITLDSKQPEVHPVFFSNA